ncbi:MAG: peroxiredoxin-like family protein [Sphingomonadales bacterium]
MTRFFFLTLSCVLSAPIIAQGQPEGVFLGAKAPDFTSTDQFGREVNLRQLAKRDPVLLVFYRGYWSPSCIRLLTRLQDSLSFFTDRNIAVVAIGPESDESRAQTLQKTRAGFSLLSDSAHSIAKRYDVLQELSESQLARYRSGGIDLTKINAPHTPHLPVPSVFLVGKDYTITYRFFDPDQKRRISVKELLQQ